MSIVHATGRIITIDAVELFLRVLSKGTGGSEVPANSNRGPYVEPVLKSVGLEPGNPWCAAEMYDAGRKALDALWPLPKTGYCPTLAEFAQEHGILFDTAERGDLFVVWGQVKGEKSPRFLHTGAVLQVLRPRVCATHEGNTSGGGSREGWLSAERTREFKREDKFIRWVNLLQ